MHAKERIHFVNAKFKHSAARQAMCEEKGGAV